MVDHIALQHSLFISVFWLRLTNSLMYGVLHDSCFLPVASHACFMSMWSGVLDLLHLGDFWISVFLQKQDEKVITCECLDIQQRSQIAIISQGKARKVITSNSLKQQAQQ